MACFCWVALPPRVRQFSSCSGRKQTSARGRAAGCLYGAAAAQPGRFQSSHPLECSHFPSASLCGGDRRTSPELFATWKTVQHGLSYQRCGEADEKFQKLKPRPRVTPGSSCFRAASHASGPHRASLMQLFLERGRQGREPSPTLLIGSLPHVLSRAAFVLQIWPFRTEEPVVRFAIAA